MRTTQAHRCDMRDRHLGLVHVYREPTAKITKQLRISYEETTARTTPGMWAASPQGAKGMISRWLKRQSKPGEKVIVDIEWHL